MSLITRPSRKSNNLFSTSTDKVTIRYCSFRTGHNENCLSRNTHARLFVSESLQSLACLGIITIADPFGNSHNPLSFTTWSQPLVHVGIVTIGYLSRKSHNRCHSRNSHNRSSIRNRHNHVPISEESQIVVCLQKRLNKCLTVNNRNQFVDLRMVTITGVKQP